METKQCTKCNVEKTLDLFEKTIAGNPYGKCKECRKAFFNEHYKNPDRKKAILQHARMTRNNNMRNMLIYLSDNPCVDCGETDPIVLEFDHVIGEKKWSISKGAHSACKWSTILEEIQKCEVRCANCHRKKTSQRAGGWYKMLE